MPPFQIASLCHDSAYLEHYQHEFIARLLECVAKSPATWVDLGRHGVPAITIKLRMAVTDGDDGAVMALPLRAAVTDYVLVADEPAVTADGQAGRASYRAIAASLAFHVVILGIFLTKPGPAFSPPLGVKGGLPEHVNVSVISDADLKSLSMDPYRQDSSPASPAATEETKPSPTPTREEATSPAKPATVEGPEDPSGFAAEASEAFSASMRRTFEAQAARKTARASVPSPPNLKFYRPAASHSGESDEFARDVVWALAATKPQGNGKWGTTAVTFVVSAAGRVQDLKLLQSSGDAWLDTGALMSVKQARLPVPPAGLPAGERTFIVEYISEYIPR